MTKTLDERREKARWEDIQRTIRGDKLHPTSFDAGAAFMYSELKPIIERMREVLEFYNKGVDESGLSIYSGRCGHMGEPASDVLAEYHNCGMSNDSTTTTVVEPTNLSNGYTFGGGYVEESRNLIEKMYALIQNMKRGDCWCEVAIGNPMASHYKGCNCERAKQIVSEVKEFLK